MRIAVIIGGTTIAMVSVGLLWQAQPSKRVLMTDDHPALIDLEFSPNAFAIQGGKPGMCLRSDEQANPVWRKCLTE